jgi:hypothetical protein
MKSKTEQAKVMVKVKRLGYVLYWIGIATMMGYSQEKASE